jgi:hypothetical protein
LIDGQKWVFSNCAHLQYSVAFFSLSKLKNSSCNDNFRFLSVKSDSDLLFLFWLQDSYRGVREFDIASLQDLKVYLWKDWSRRGSSQSALRTLQQRRLDLRGQRTWSRLVQLHNSQIRFPVKEYCQPLNSFLFYLNVNI